ncbi:PREDICTED: calmodulin-binding protein 60 A-like isoform X2 [Ipomoea nil]|uniref:calmodulin-binding protein 60 A-like isoform X2 n=1 Tax=Ipomoea nil TaxID=35883 RepID=UPI000901F5D5|nr:PREDICTED: calmodulin-binding protein 60 A-like isoform X2 [Ipomoea nil]
MSSVVMQSEELLNLGSLAQTGGSDDGGLLNIAKLEKVIEVLAIRTINRVLEPTMADLVRRVVRKELEEAQLNLMRSFKGNPENGSHTSNPIPRRLKLKFLQMVSDLVLTGKEIKGEGGSVLNVALLDDLTEKVIETGSEASAEIEIVALQGELDDAVEDNWTSQVFNESIKRVNNANKSLLQGNVRLKLNKGVGILQNVKFRQCSDWTSNCKYMLGARVVGASSGTVVKEAKTKSFTVKDSRVQLYKKHEFPDLSDDVWQLKNIDRKGKIYDRLKEKQVETVEKFLVRLLRDSEQLKEILKIAPKRWMETVNHARRCKIDERVYWYADSQDTGVVFDLFGEVLGLVLQGRYRRTEELSMDEQDNALKLKESACRHWEDIVTFGDENSFIQHLGPSDSMAMECHNDREVINHSYSPHEATLQHVAHSGQDFGSTSHNNDELSDSPIRSPSHNSYWDMWNGLMVGHTTTFGLVANHPLDGSFQKVDARKRLRMVFLKVHALKRLRMVYRKELALNRWRMVFDVVKSSKRKRGGKPLGLPNNHAQKRLKSFDQDHAIK